MSFTAGQVGDPQVRHRGTIGGSVSHSDPASDLPAVLFALDAEMVVRGPGGERTVPAIDFCTGVFQTALQAGRDARGDPRAEARPRSTGWSYVKMARRAQDWATVGVAAIVERSNGVDLERRDRAHEHGRDPRAGAGRGARRSPTAPSIDEAAAARRARARNPPSDHAASAEFRQHLAERADAKRALDEAAG